MKIGLDVLRRVIDLPDDPRAVHRLLDEQGLEVKRAEGSGETLVFTLELLANRGDHHSYEGVARELNGRLGVGIRRPEVAPLEVGACPWPLQCETDACPSYTATLLERPPGEAGDLSPEALRVLEAAGIHSLAAPVDATNVANLELGQPTHAFDADTLVGPITIRHSRAGETALPLFAEERIPLPEGTLVIADDEKILAIAGVIGCDESKTTAETRRLLLESATFDPVAVRRGSRSLEIFTDSSARFERGADPQGPLVGAGRVVALLEATTTFRRVGATGVVGHGMPLDRTVPLEASTTTTFLGVPVSADDIVERLSRYGFGCTVAADGDTVTAEVPSWRLWDVETSADLLEEIAKSIGYDETPIALPPVDLGAQPSPREKHKAAVDQVLLGHGFYEVFTDGFYGRSVFEQLGIGPDHPLHDHVETTNALERGYSLLKNNALHQALEAAAVNDRRRTQQGRMYEWTRTFHPRPTTTDGPPQVDRPPCDENPLLWMMCFGTIEGPTWTGGGRPADVLFLKGVLEELGVELGLDLELSPGDPSHPLASALHPGRRGIVRLQGETVGILGEIHPAVCRRYKIKTARPCYLEVVQAALFRNGVRPDYVEPPRLQPLVRSLAFGIPLGVDAGDVGAWLHASGPEGLETVRIVDLFQLDGGDRSITFELTYTNPGNQRTSDAINEATDALVRSVEAQFGPRGVRQR